MSSPIPDFVRLADGVSYHQSMDTTPPHDPSPRLILLCTWMGALPRHITKYTAAHRTLHPHASILVIQSDLPDVLFRTLAFQNSRMAPARAIIHAALSDSQPILLHVFSNGGAMSACQLSTQLRADMGRPLPLRAVIFDSCPGQATFMRSLRAFGAGLPRGTLPKLLGQLLISFFLVLVRVLEELLRVESPVDRARRMLNDVAVFAVEAPRAYVYSKADEMVDWRDVREHAGIGRGKGYMVREDIYEDSPHVAHAMVERERYWKLVEDMCAR